jgi:hypothetical protein
MSIDQAPETVESTVDPDAPFGRRADGSAYKRDPGPFQHLRGKPFGSSATSSGGSAPTKRTGGSSGKPRASAAPPPPLKQDAQGYAAKFQKGFHRIAQALARKAPVPAIIIAVRAPEMAESWGEVAVAYPKVGRFVDRLSKTSVLGDAIGSTGLTVLLIAHGQGLTQGTPFGDYLEDEMQELIAKFEASEQFDKMKTRMNEAENARQAAAMAKEVALKDAANGGD